MTALIDPCRRAGRRALDLLARAAGGLVGPGAHGRGLQREIAQRDRTMRRSHEAVTRILRDELLPGRSLKEQLRALTRIGAEALDIDVVSVWEADATGQQGRCLERWNAGAGGHIGLPNGAYPIAPEFRRKLSENLVHRTLDARQDPILGAYTAQAFPPDQAVSIMTTAIRHGDQLVGTLAFASVGRPRDWTIEEETFARSLADLAGLALLKDQLDRRDRAQRRNQNLLIHLVRDHLINPVPLRTLLGSITETIGSALNIDRTGVWVLDNANGAYECLDIWDNVRREHACDAVLALDTGSPITHEMKRSFVLAFDDIVTSPLVETEQRVRLVAKSIKSVLMVMIGGPDQPLGLLTFASTRARRAWTLEDQTLARSLADVISFVLLKDQIDRRERDLRRNQGLLLRVVRDQLLQAAPIETTLRAITESVGTALGIDRTSIWQMDEQAREFRCADRWNNPLQQHELASPIPRSMDSGLFDALLTTTVVAIDDYETDSRVTPRLRDVSGVARPKSQLTALVRAPDGPIGLIAFNMDSGRRHWTIEDQALALSMADLIAFAFLAHRYGEVIAALDLVGDGVLVQGPAAEVIYANRAARTLGVADVELRAGQLATVAGLAEDDGPAREIPWVMPDGTGRELTVTRRRLPDGGVITMLSDITERRERQRRHELIEERLRQSTKMEAVGRLAGGVAHDFNNMMGAILGFATFLVEDLAPGTAQQDFAKRITEVCERSRDIVKQLLTFSRPGDVTKRTADLRTAVTENSSLLQAALPDSTRFSIVAGDEPLTVLANPGQLAQLLLNLCVNANDALEGTSGSVTVTLGRIGLDHPDRRLFEAGARDGQVAALAVGGRLDPARPYGVIRVADTGAGMNQATLDQIFEPFFTTKERNRGTGLGLAVVHGIVTAHDGAYVVRSRITAGSEFSIYLPLDEPATAEIAVENRTGVQHGAESVLVVDDEVDLTDMLSIGLGRLGYDVTSSNDPLEVFDAFEQDPHAWDVLVTDQMMPNLKGLALIQRLKAIRPDLVTLLCTGFADGTTEEAARNGGADAFLLKPLEPSRIAEQIRTLCDRRVADPPVAPAL